MKSIIPISLVLALCACAYLGLVSCEDHPDQELDSTITTQPATNTGTGEVADVDADAETNTKTDANKEADIKENASSDPIFPSGQSTPEGVACDMARAFINTDKNLWMKINHPTLTNNYPHAKEFVEDIAKQMDEMAIADPKDRLGPKEILRVYKARHLSMNGPASAGFALFNFEDVMFVDLVVLESDGMESDGMEYHNRTLVIKDKSKWYIVPRPDLYKLLSAGLNSESMSTELFENK